MTGAERALWSHVCIPWTARSKWVKTGHGTTDWFQIGKGVCQDCILSPSLFKLYSEYIMRNAGLDEAQAGIKIAGRNINNLRYADNTTLLAESEEELKSCLLKVKEEWKRWLKTQHSKHEDHGIWSQWHGNFNGKWMGKQWKQWQALFSWAPKSLQVSDCSHEIKRRLLLEEKLWQT